MALGFVNFPRFGRRTRRIGIAVFVVVALVIIALFVAPVFFDSSIRSHTQALMNSRLKGYHSAVGGAHLALIDGNLTLKNVSVVQDAHPDPPVMQIPSMTMHIEWRKLFTGHVVADAVLNNPRFHIDLTQLRQEASSKVPVTQKGWQDAIQAIYPFKINTFRIRDGDFTYIDVNPQKPLHLEHVSLIAGNIRNVFARQKTYPSTLWAQATIFGRGQLTVNGYANFLAKPFAGVWLYYTIKNMPLEPFDPVISRVNLTVTNGILHSDGIIQYAPWIEQGEVYHADVDRIRLDYVTKPAPNPTKQKVAVKTKQTAKQVNNKPGLILKIDVLHILHSHLTYTDEAKQPNYKLYFDDLDVRATNFSNHFTEGVADVHLTGRFMGSGDTVVNGTFRPETQGPDFSLNVAIRNTDMTALNDLLRAYGKFDVAAGRFSLFSQLAVKEGEMHGYVKPLFSDVKVYSHQKDKNKSVVKKAYEATVGAVMGLLKNPSTQKVATQVQVSGRISNPNMSTWEALVEMLRNAFIKAILPGFDAQVHAVNASSTGGK